MDHVCICIATFRRNQMLEHLLSQIACQRTDGAFSFSVVLIDNDPAGQARVVAEKATSQLQLSLLYEIEQERSIPAARNHALRLAQGDYIAIIDDDEFPPHDWLVTLYHAISAFRVDGCLGPVYPYFQQRPPSWLLRGGFCERPVHRTGTLLDWDETRTGNVLLRTEVFHSHGLWFDCNLRTGGSDREFFKRAIRLGYRFVAVQEAPVFETVPPERWTRKYYLNRALLNGSNAHKSILGEMKPWRGAAMLGKSALALLFYAILCPLSACVGRHRLVRSLEGAAYHASRLLAFFGLELMKERNF